MKLCVTGINHKTTPTFLRGKIVISSSRLQEALSSLQQYVPQGIVLCTCNRIEIYTATDQNFPADSACIEFLNSKAEPGIDLSPYIYVYRDEEAVEHLFQVASGLDSMIIGEFEILGQVRNALEEAEKSGLVELPLLGLFREAVRAGRRARNETCISENALSISSVAVDMAVQILGTLQERKVVILGAGEAGRLAARVAKGKGAGEIVVSSRSPKNAPSLLKEVGGRWVSLNGVEKELGSAELLISCTGAPHFVVRRPMIERAINSHPGHTLAIIDIAVPQDVEPEVKQIPGVFLYDIDDFVEIAELNYRKRENEISKAMEIINEEVQRFLSWWQTLEVRPVIKALMTKAEDIRQRQLNLTLKKLPQLSEEENFYLEAMTKAIVKQLLHEPIQCLKEDTPKRKKYTEVVNEIFGLNK